MRPSIPEISIRNQIRQSAASTPVLADQRMQVAQRYLGGNHAVTITLRNSTLAARRAISARDNKIREELLRRNKQKTKFMRQTGRAKPKPIIIREDIDGIKTSRCVVRKICGALLTACLSLGPGVSFLT